MCASDTPRPPSCPGDRSDREGQGGVGGAAQGGSFPSLLDRRPQSPGELPAGGAASLARPFLPEAATRPVLPGTPCPFPQVSVLPDPGAAAQRCFKAGGKRGVCDTVFYRRKLTETCSQRLTKGPAASGSASSPGLRASDLLLVLVNSICFALARHQNNLPT